MFAEIGSCVEGVSDSLVVFVCLGLSQHQKQFANNNKLAQWKSLNLIFVLLLFNFLYKRARHIGGADCHEAVDDDAYPLLAVVTGYGAYYAFEFAFGDADLLAFLEFGDDGGGGYDVLGVGGTDDL